MISGGNVTVREVVDDTQTYKDDVMLLHSRLADAAVPQTSTSTSVTVPQRVQDSATPYARYDDDAEHQDEGDGGEDRGGGARIQDKEKGGNKIR